MVLNIRFLLYFMYISTSVHGCEGGDLGGERGVHTIRAKQDVARAQVAVADRRELWRSKDGQWMIILNFMDSEPWRFSPT